MTVFNTATVNDVIPGLYYNDGTKWVNVSANLPTNQFWNLTGNTGTMAGTNYLGTNDNTDLVFKVNGSVSGWINNALFNTSLGYNSLSFTTTGNNNCSIGTFSLNGNTTGDQNTAIGAEAMQFNMQGYLNTATGASALQYNIFGGLNTACGVQSMLSNFSGNSNTAMGYISLNANADGNNNTAVGANALGANKHGGNNTGLGYQALQTNTTGSGNVAVGYNAASTLTSGDNNIVIGNNSQPSTATAANEVTLGNATNNVYRMYAASWTVASDRNLKHDIKELPVGLDFVMALRPVEFVYNNANNETKSMGFIAQDVQEDMKGSNMDQAYGLVNKLDEKNLGLNTGELIPILTKAIQEQQKIIEEQNKRIERLEQLILKKN
jgi:hypothetical protein